MKSKIYKKKEGLFFLTSLFLWTFYSTSFAQLNNYQTVTTKCYTGPTISLDNTTGTMLSSVNFVAGVDIPLGHKVVDVIVEVVWSKTDIGSCIPPTNLPVDLSHVGFLLRGPVGGNRYLAASGVTGLFASAVTTPSFAGATGVDKDTIVFRDGYPSLLPATMPVLGRDTVAPNNDSLSYYWGIDPYGIWSLGGIDDLPSTGPSLCIYSYCITLVTCDYTSLKASCKTNTTVALGATGIHSFDLTDLDSISDVSCMVKNISFSPSTVNCSDIGSQIPVTMTIKDHLDSVQSCVTVVSVVDNAKPVITGCYPSIYGVRYLDVNGKDTFRADSIIVVDNCMPVIKQVKSFWGTNWQPYVVFSCVSSYQQFWFKTIDASGNSDSCIIVVNIVDTVPPTAVCGQDTAFLTTATGGEVTVFPIDLDAGSYDVCPPIIGRWIGAQYAPPPIYTCADVGTDTVLLIVSDIHGNLDTCNNAVVVIIDKTPPTAVSQNDTIYLDAFGNGLAYASNIENGSVDTCGVDSFNINGAATVSFNCSHVNAPQPITFNVFDASGNVDSCPATVVVRDTFPPIATCKNKTININANGGASLLADSLNDNSVDLCTGTNLSFEVAGNSIVLFNCGDIASSPNPINLTVLDSFGNMSTCVSFVTVVDTVNPIANCTSPTAFLNNVGVATLYASDLSANSFDNCMVVDSFVNTVGGAFSIFNCTHLLSPQSATLIVQDAFGNVGSCTAVVNVVDTVSPQAFCEANYSCQLNAQGLATVMPSNIDSNSIDNCGLVEYLIDGASSRSYTCADLGLQMAVLSVRDASGNTSSCMSQIEVQDNIVPTANCQSKTVFLDAWGLAIITSNDVLDLVGSTDNCSIASSSFSFGGSITYTCDSIGIHALTVFVADASGNTASCLATVTVLDSVSPVAICRPVPFSLQLDAIGNAFVIPTNINYGSMDLCGVDTMLVNGLDSFGFDCSNLGINSVMLTVIDASGNQSVCMGDVMVTDIITPTALCVDTVVYLDLTGSVSLMPCHIDGGSSDNCSFISTINGAVTVNYSCIDAGIVTAQLLITDSTGNFDQCSANITVLDTIAPIALCKPIDTLYFQGGLISINPVMIDIGSSDNCGLQSMTLSQSSFDCPDIGVNIINLVVMDISGNIGTCNSTIIVLDSTAMAEAGPTQVLCAVDSTSLTAAAIGANLNGLWTTSSAAIIDNPMLPTSSIRNLSLGNNVFYWTLSNATCSNLSMDSVVVIMVSESPDIALAGIDQNHCEDSSVILTSNAPLISTGQWKQNLVQANAGVVISDSSDPLSSVTGLLPGNSYSFVWELTNGLCGVHARDTVVINVDFIPDFIAEAGEDITCSPDTLFLEATAVFNGGGGLWSTPSAAIIASAGQANSMATNFVQDTSIMIWTLSNGACLDYSEDTVLVILGAQKPIAMADSFSLIPDGNSTIVDVSLNDNLPLNWVISPQSFMEEGQLLDMGNGQFDIDVNGITSNQDFAYEVCNLDCPIICDTATVFIEISPAGDCYAPNMITPNGDGSNDYFVIPCLASIDEKATLSIFNRWGSIVYEANYYQSDWDGTHENQPLPNGVYFYILQIGNKQAQQGAIEVKR